MKMKSQLMIRVDSLILSLIQLLQRRGIRLIGIKLRRKIMRRLDLLEGIEEEVEEEEEVIEVEEGEVDMVVVIEEVMVEEIEVVMVEIEEAMVEENEVAMVVEKEEAVDEAEATTQKATMAVVAAATNKSKLVITDPSPNSPQC